MSAALQLSDKVTSLPGVGPATYFKLQKRGVETICDLLRIYPNRYDDFRIIKPAKSLQPGDKATVIGTISNTVVLVTKRRGLTITKATLFDLSGSIDLIWFNQPYIRNNLTEDVLYSVSGTCDFFSGKKVLKVSEYEEKSDQLHSTAALVPYYSEVYGVTQKFFRSKIAKLLGLLKESELDEYLPEAICTGFKLPSVTEFYRAIHTPKKPDDIERAHFRIAFEEIFSSVLTQEKIKLLLQNKSSFPLDDGLHEKTLSRFVSTLPFTMTAAQMKTVNEIATDMRRQHPMNRLLLGDVGSGKTVVMAYALLLTALQKKGSLVLVPTETLARQHYASLTQTLSPFGVSVGLMTGKTGKDDFGAYDIIVGTHALLYHEVDNTRIALIIIDEQHKFGVDQRNDLITKSSGKIAPHMLFVSATPIPRSLALTIFGSLDISYIDEMPVNRKPVKTYVVPEEKRHQAYDWIAKNLRKNKSQMYVVCPLISTSTNEKMLEKKSVTEELEHLKKIFPTFHIAAIHSKERDKEKVFGEFKAGRIDILISTTVIEVGVDVPNAAIMFIEDADRFGLSQLHQLRGRVGRSSLQSYCFLFSGSNTPEAFSRLRAMETSNDGFKLAEIDLKLRGSGDVFGLSQHGFSSYVEKYLFNAEFLAEIKHSVRELLAMEPNFNYNSKIRDTSIGTVSTDINLN